MWANYQLVSTQWTSNGTVIPTKLANITMETYFQDNAFSCISCHSLATTASQANSADKSYLLESAYPHSSLLRETPDRSVILDFTGQAEKGGSGAANAKVRVTGSALIDGDLNLGTAALGLRSLLREESGAGELLAKPDGTPLLPMNLSPRPDSTATAVIFETPAGVQPQLRVEVKNQDPGQGLLAFTLAANGATIPKGPTRCGSGASPTTILTTRFTLVDGTNVPVTVTAVHPWQCNGEQFKPP